MPTKQHKYGFGLLLSALVSCILSFSACSIVDSPDGQFALELVTKAGTAEILKGDKDKAAELVKASDYILEAVSAGTLVTPAEVDAEIKKTIMSLDVQPATKQAIMVFADSIREHYIKRIDLGQLDPESAATVVQIVSWVKQAAEDTIAFGGAAPSYGVPVIGAQLQEPDDSLWAYITDRNTRKRNPLPWQEEPQKLDTKWYPGVTHMLENPTTLPDVYAREI